MENQLEWRRWLEENTPKFLLFARQKSRCEADAQDLVQEAMVEVVRKTPANSTPQPGLVFTLIRHRAIDWARREDRRANREKAAAPNDSEVWFDPAVEDREAQQLIQQAMKQIPEIYQEVITLKIWGGLTFAEIADVLGIPLNTAASRYKYGLAELRTLTREVLA